MYQFSKQITGIFFAIMIYSNRILDDATPSIVFNRYCAITQDIILETDIGVGTDVNAREAP